MQNLNSIAKEQGQEFEQQQLRKAFKDNKEKLERQQKEIQKYMNMDNCDLFSEEARKSLTKYKVYKAKKQTLEHQPTLVREVKSSARLAEERDFVVLERQAMPEDLAEDEIVATQMDLYLTINLTENLQKARTKRKLERVTA